VTDEENEVDAWLDRQSHAMTDAARTIRASILRTAPSATESIKWQAPNFALEDDFATFSMRRPGVLQVILHTGVKPKPELETIDVGDLGGRLRWAGHNRAVITFTSADDVSAALPEFEQVIARWTAAG
jgi:hypothetical protein